MTMTAAELMAADIGPREFAVDNLIPLGGVAVLSAKKWRNKSVFALCMADKVSRGKTFLGRGTKRGGVLYIGTEDDEIELHTRYSDLLESSGEKPSPLLDLDTGWPRVRDGGIAKLRKWIEAAESPRLIVVDLAIGVAPELVIVRRGWTGVMDALTPWLELAREENVAILLVVHSFRGPDFVDNPVEKVQGSGGLTAYVQTVLVIEGKDQRPERLLSYGGKFGAGRLGLLIDAAAMTCEVADDDPAELREQSEVRALLTATVRRYPGRKARALAAKLPERTVDSTVRMLQLMADQGDLTVRNRCYFVNADAETGQQVSLSDPLLAA